MQFQNLWGALALVLLVPLVLLYLLRQRYREVRVPSTALWEQVLAQYEAAHPWQRWRRNLLFVLQLLAVCLLALALMRPVWRTGGAGEHSIVVLDLSMSMQAQEGGQTRLDRAKDGVRGLAEGMQRHGEVSLILSGDQNEPVVSRSRDKAALLQLLEQVDAGNGGSRLREALQMAGSLRDADGGGRIHVFTDYDIEVYDDDTVVHNVALGAENVAVTNASYSRSSRDGSLNVLGLLYNFGQARTVHVELWGDGALLDVRECGLANDSPGNVLFEGMDGNLQNIVLAVSEQDALPADNRAYLVVQDSVSYRVLLQTERNVFLEKAILVRDDIELYKTPPTAELPQERYDLVIGDGWLGESLPEGQSIWMIAPEHDTEWLALQEAGPGDIRIAATDRAQTLLRYVDLSGMQVAQARSFDVLDGGTTVLAYLGDAPLMVMQDEDAKRLAFGFDFHESNLPLQKDFPILVQNILAWFLPARQGQNGQVTAGDPMQISLQSDAVSYRVRRPDGSAVSGGGRQFEATQQLGFYAVTQLDAAGREIETSTFAVNAAVLEESELRTAGGGTEGQGGRAGEGLRRQSLWPYAILCALMLMALEWWVYHRGV